MAPSAYHAENPGAHAPRGELSDEGQQGIKVVVPAVIGAIFAIALIAIVCIWAIVRQRMKRREKKFWKQAEARNSIRNSRMMALSEQGSIATRDSYATLDSLASGVSGPPVYNSALLPSFPSERSLRNSMMSLSSAYSSPYDPSPLARNTVVSRAEDPWDSRSDADPGEGAEGVPMLAAGRSPRPSLTIDTGANKPPAYNRTYVTATEYPQVVVSEPQSRPSSMPVPVQAPAPASSSQQSLPDPAARDEALAEAAARLDGHDYEYAQAIANAANAAADDGNSAGHHSTHSTHEVVRSDGGHVRPSTIIQVTPTNVPARQQSVSAEVVDAKAP